MTQLPGRSVFLISATLYIAFTESAVIPTVPADTKVIQNPETPIQSVQALANFPDFDRGVLSLRPSSGCKNDYGPGVPLYYCPSHAWNNPFEWPCIRHTDLCNGIADCPRAEDEHPALCMFHLAEGEELKQIKLLIAKHFLQNHADEVPNVPGELLATREMTP